jgi:hypothetical protein
VKHRASGWRRAVGFYAGMFHVKQRAGGRKTRFCKTTPCIKKYALFFNDVAMRSFGT